MGWGTLIWGEVYTMWVRVHPGQVENLKLSFGRYTRAEIKLA